MSSVHSTQHNSFASHFLIHLLECTGEVVCTDTQYLLDDNESCTTSHAQWNERGQKAIHSHCTSSRDRVTFPKAAVQETHFWQRRGVVGTDLVKTVTQPSLITLLLKIRPSVTMSSSGDEYPPLPCLLREMNVHLHQVFSRR